MAKANNKIKQKKGTVKFCNNCFSPKYIKFNLSYFKPDNDFKGHEAQLLKRMISISSEDYVLLMNKPKEVSFEFEKVDIGRQIPEGFKNRFKDKDYSKFAIMRLYPNNNPVMGRVIGVIINKVFYIFYVFIGEKGYKR